MSIRIKRNVELMLTCTGKSKTGMRGKVCDARGGGGSFYSTLATLKSTPGSLNNAQVSL